MINSKDNIIRNIKDIMQKITIAANKSGRDAKDIKVIAVTKTIPYNYINILIDEGFLDFGESKAKELCEKYDNITRDCNWHLIGHLQTNKVKYIIDKVCLIHSVDSYKLACEIERYSEEINKVTDILVQVNVAMEQNKYGLYPNEVLKFIYEISNFKHIKITGLMTMAPYTNTPEDIRSVFKELKKIYIDIKKEDIDNINMNYLSMGMSNDFEIAIEEGSNMVRIGTALFGERN